MGPVVAIRMYRTRRTVEKDAVWLRVYSAANGRGSTGGICGGEQRHRRDHGGGGGVGMGLKPLHPAESRE